MERANSLNVTNLPEIQELGGTFLSRLTQFSNNIIQKKTKYSWDCKESFRDEKKNKRNQFFLSYYLDMSLQFSRFLRNENDLDEVGGR